MAIAGEVAQAATLAALDAEIVAGRRPKSVEPAVIQLLDEPVLEAAGRRLRANLTLRSVHFRDALRLGVALALALALVHVLDLHHGFWVVLATLTVVRTTASATSITARRAVLGTAVGFVLSVVVILGAEADSHLYVVLLGLVVCAAVYAARAGGVLAGQAAFTVLVVVLFSLMAPSEWTLALVRVQDVVAGRAGGRGHRPDRVAAGRRRPAARGGRGRGRPGRRRGRVGRTARAGARRGRGRGGAARRDPHRGPEGGGRPGRGARRAPRDGGRARRALARPPRRRRRGLVLDPLAREGARRRRAARRVHAAHGRAAQPHGGRCGGVPRRRGGAAGGSPAASAGRPCPTTMPSSRAAPGPRRRTRRGARRSCGCWCCATGCASSRSAWDA